MINLYNYTRELQEILKGKEETKHFPPASKEWQNSIYTFDRNFEKTIPTSDNMVNRLIRSYFSLTPLFGKKKSRRVQVRNRRLSMNKIHTSEPEVKHTNEKAVITVYLYNKNKAFLLRKMNNLFKTMFSPASKKTRISRRPKLTLVSRIINNIAAKPLNRDKTWKANLASNKSLSIKRGTNNINYETKFNPLVNSNKNLSSNFLYNIQMIVKKLNLHKNAKKRQNSKVRKVKNIMNIKRVKYISAKSVKLMKKVRRYKNFVIKLLKWNNKSFIRYEDKYYNKFMKRVYRKELLYTYYTKMLMFNNSKFKTWFLLGLKRVLSKIYNKNVEFNFVNLKYLYLNSDIFTESIAIKLKNRQNRLLTVLKKSLSLVKLSKINKKAYNIRDSLGNFIKIDSPGTMESKQISVLSSLKHRSVFGVRLEAAGRLSKRLTASRSVFKLKYKGSLKNVDSSNRGLSSPILRGNTKPNLQYTKISNKTRNGAFGLKGWVSSY